jgi:hypothetical protein
VFSSLKKLSDPSIYSLKMISLCNEKFWWKGSSFESAAELYGKVDIETLETK